MLEGQPEVAALMSRAACSTTRKLTVLRMTVHRTIEPVLCSRRRVLQTTAMMELICPFLGTLARGFGHSWQALCDLLLILTLYTMPVTTYKVNISCSTSE
jgi:hypothetical protein